MALNALGIEVPADSDDFAPALDMRELGASMAGRVVVPVANELERDALAATLSPSPASPLYVHRADAPASARLEWTEDGSTWRRAATSGDWQDWTLISSGMDFGGPGANSLCRYVDLGGTIAWEVRLQPTNVATASTVSFDLPVPPRLTGAQRPFAQVNYVDANGANYMGFGVSSGAENGRVVLRYLASGGEHRNFNVSTPFSWSPGDIILATGVYEAA